MCTRVRREECGARKVGGRPLIENSKGARAHPPSPPQGDHFGKMCFRSFRSPAPEVGLHDDRTGVASRVASKESRGTSPSRRAGEKCRPGSGPFPPIPPLPHQDLFSLFLRGSPGFVCAAPHMAGQMGHPLRKTSILAGFYCQLLKHRVYI